MKVAKRIETLPPYLFAEIDRKIAAKRAAGVDVISFGVGDPDSPTPTHIVEAMRAAAADPATHQYPSYFGMAEFRRAIAAWYGRRFGVTLDPDAEVLPLIGSYIDPGDTALVPDPGYPVYQVATHLAGGTGVPFALSAERGFLPDWNAVAVPDRAKVVWLNYPCNPTAAVATLDDFAAAVEFARANDLLLAHDNAYSEITYDGFVAPSAMQIPGARDVAVEFHSLSKTYNMTGWRCGFVVGCAEAIEALGRVKTNIDSGIFNAIQRAGVAALNGPQDFLDDLRELYRRRRDLVVKTFNEMGWSLEPPRGSIYVWLPVPSGHDSASFATLLLDGAGVVVPPGRGYGEAGEGYIRISLTVPDDRLEEGLERIRSAIA
ncbi:MAG: aminotransferase class I/II-fold pyridoxal phosphate-dependent enzyme [Actinobacteria bacterium]|nr:MAG: aminotransferase class I/II-fold pyridoxal phosphate-dependent enzyme [Actinomycetota bacterium]